MGLVSLQVQTQEVLVAVWWVNEVLLVLELLLEASKACSYYSPFPAFSEDDHGRALPRSLSPEGVSILK